MAWTTNYIPNPSLELDLTGYAAVGQTLLSHNPTISEFGNYSLQADTNGADAGEGVRSPEVTPNSGSVTGSVYLSGSAVDVELLLVANPGGIILGTTTISMDLPWSRHTVTGTMSLGQTVYLLLRTVNANVATFSTDGWQIENGSTAHAYCDGDQYGCVWLGDPHASVSVQEVQFPIEGGAGSVSEGTAAAYVPGPVPILAHGASHSSGTIEVNTALPRGAFDDFGTIHVAEPDPAKSMVIAGNIINSGPSGGPWARNYMVCLAPVQSSTWNRAAYAAVGFRFENVPNTKGQYWDCVQFETSKTLDPASEMPTAYDSPRKLGIVIKPDRLNYVTNPRFVDSLAAGWAPTGNVTAAFDPPDGALVTNTLPSAVFTQSFTGADALITNEYAHFNPTDPASVISPDWDMTSGSFFRRSNVGWSGVPDSVDPNATSSTGTGSNVFRMNSKRFNFQNVKIDVKVRNLGISAGTDATHGIHIWCRFKDQTELYVASLNRRDNTLVIKKKLTGGPDPENGGTYYTLAEMPYAWTPSVWQNFSVTCTGVDVVTITVAKDGVDMLTATDDGTLGGRTINGATAVGVRGDFCQFEIDDFAVNSVDGDDPTGSFAHTFIGTIPGREYTFSAMVRWHPSIKDIILKTTWADAEVSVLQFGPGASATPYGSGPYGDGLYGGEEGEVPPELPWYRVYFTFTAVTIPGNGMETVSFIPYLTDTEAAGHFWIDDVMVEEGNRLRDFFDGSFPGDYIWSEGGTPNQTQSFYYQGLLTKISQVRRIVVENTPVGITGGEPVYGVLPSQ